MHRYATDVRKDTPLHVPWMRDVSPQVQEIAQRRPQLTVFTRFVPPKRAEDVPGMRRSYYEKWDNMTLDRLRPNMIDLVPSLKVLVPPAHGGDDDCGDRGLLFGMGSETNRLPLAKPFGASSSNEPPYPKGSLPCN